MKELEEYFKKISLDKKPANLYNPIYYTLSQGGKRLLSAEMSNGQMRDDIKLAIDCACPVELVNRLGGNLITHEQILAKVREMAKA